MLRYYDLHGYCVVYVRYLICWQFFYIMLSGMCICSNLTAEIIARLYFIAFAAYNYPDDDNYMQQKLYHKCIRAKFMIYRCLILML